MMSFLTTVAAHPIIVLFLLANLVIGFWAHTKAKANSFEDYALASRSLPTGVLVMTLLGTLLDSGYLAFPDHAYSYGLLHITAPITTAFAFLFVGTFIAPNLVYFNDCSTLGDIMARMYGELGRLFSGVISLVFCLLMVSAQIHAMVTLGDALLDIPPVFSVLVFGSIIVFYSVWGGMRAVSYTDVFQMIAALVALSWVIQALLQKTGGSVLSFQNLQKEYSLKVDFFSYHRLKRAHFWSFSLAWVLTPPIMQRMLMSKEKRQVRQMWYTGTLLHGFISSILILIGLVAFANNYNFDTEGNPKELLLNIVKNLFMKNSWIMEALFIGFLAFSVSTMDSYLHLAGLAFVQDLVNPVRKLLGKNDSSLKDKTSLVRQGVCIIGVLSLIIGLTDNTLANAPFHKSLVLIYTMVITPLVIGILGIKTDRASWISFSIIYLACIGILSWLNWDAYDYFFVAMPMAILAYFTTHIYINGGIVILKRSEQTVAEQLWLPTWKGTVKYFKSWLLSPLQLHILAGRKIVNSPTQSLPFSMLIFALYTFSSVMTGAKADMGLANFMAGVHVIGITLCCGLMLEGIWPDKLKPYFALYWFTTLFYCLPLGGTLAFLRAHEGAVSSILWVSSFAVLAFLVDSNTFCLLSMLGAGLSTIIWRLIVGSLPNDLWNDSSLTGTGILVLMVISILLFSRSREQYSSQRLNWNRTASSILGHDLRNTANMLSGVASVINSTFKMSQPASNSEGKKGYWIEKQHGKFLEDYAQKLTQKSTDTKREIKNFMGFMEQQVIGWLEQEKMSMHKTVKDVVASMKDKYANSMQITVSCTKDFEANVFSVFPNVIANLIKNASVHGQATKVTVKVDGVKRTLTVRDNGKGISADVLPRIFDLNFTTGDKGKKNAGVGLAFVKMVMNASSGKVSCHSRKGDEKSFTEFAMAFPQA